LVELASSSGSDQLDHAATEAVRGCRSFPRVTEGGRPSAYVADAPYTFRLEN
jgi:TonB family protein